MSMLATLGSTLGGTLAATLAVAALVLWLSTTMLWLASLVLRDTSIIDIFWGPLFVLVAWTGYALAPATSPARDSGEPLLVLLLVTTWGLRLGFHLFARKLAERTAGQHEDPRYRRWREAAGPSWWWRSYLKVFCLQAVVALLVATPVLAVLANPSMAPLGAGDALGVLLWSVGFGVEAMADLQLTRHRAGNAPGAQGGGPLCTGLWRYSRHPNYFGDALQWWGLAAIAIAGAQPAAANLWALLGPLAMTAVFLQVSTGMLERSLLTQRPGYKDYLARTPRFLPWFPKRHD